MIDDGSTDRTVEVARELRRRAHRPPDQQQGPRRRLPGRARRLPEARRRRDRQHRRRQPVPRRRHPEAGRADPRRRGRHGRRRPPGRARSSTSPAPRSACSGSAAGSCGALSGTEITDTTSGFRAYNREAALQLLVVDNFTYTLESLIQAGKMLVAVDQVQIGTNPKTRESRLFAIDRRLRAPQRAGDPAHLRPLRAAARLHHRRRASSRCSRSPPGRPFLPTGSSTATAAATSSR